MMMASRLGKWTNVLDATLKFAIITAHCQILRWSRDECCLIQVHIFSASSPKYSKFTFTSALWGKNTLPSTLFPHEFNLCSPTVGYRISHLQKTVILYFYLRWFFCLFQFLFTVLTNIRFIRSQRLHLRLSGQTSCILTYLFPKPQLR